MIKSSYLLIGLILLAFAACKESEKKTPNGLTYTVIKTGTDKRPKAGEILLFNFLLKDSKDSVWTDSYKSGIPTAIEIRDTSNTKQQDGVTQMLHMLSVGDSVKTTMSVNDFFKKLVGAPAPPQVDTTRKVTYYIKAVDIKKLDEFIKWRNKAIADHDTKEISKYLADNKIEAKQDTSGLFYVIHNNTGAQKPTVNNCVEIKYKGKFLKNGQVFDQNDRISYPLSQFIRGWKEAIPMLGKGDSGTFYIPSHLAYGPQGYYGIPADAILIFDVTLLDFKNTYDETTKTCK